ncbi:hypothetical protein GJV85_11520 [Sulfurimonas aquatica]|uniref:Lipoprotein n=1 Tax=Sulfurimonas aquatica TaxID=2672570 RepID=A0A975GDV6_9BACT|nr:hypothetical protein [Sulfurimonas aquatica]QSZ42714.1 hypothetical protein GJV85_11520 [Sulfurimonas aquatica]
MKLSTTIIPSFLAASLLLSFTGCGGGNSTTPTTTITNTTTSDTTSSSTSTSTKETLSGEITADKTLTADKVWLLTGLVAVKNGATLTIEPGTTVIGKAGTGANTSYLVVDAGSKINAAGTAAKPIIFTSETSYDGGADAWGQWGGLTIIGNAGNAQVDPYEVNPAFVAGTSNMADNSGVLTYVKILNSGITMEENKEINGLSLVGVGSGTTVDNITVDLSDDDGIEIWGGTVNLSNVTISRCSDDHFDIDDGFSGKVTNLNLNVTTGNAGIEMSGETAATFDGFNIAVSNSAKEGGIYFKKAGIGGHFKNGIITYDTTTNGYGAIHSSENNNATNTSFTNVTLKGSNADKFTGDSAASIEASFDAGLKNIKYVENLSGEITADRTLTADKIWVINGLVAVKNSATLTIEAGTTILGKAGTGANTAYMVVDKNSKIMAAGTADKHIVFTSEIAYDSGVSAVGQWGGLTIIGNAGNAQVDPYEVNPLFVAGSSDMADNSGVLQYVDILNSGITMEENKEINGLSMVGVGSGTTVENITVNKSDDDCVEIWGGSVNLTNVTLSECTDDHFDIDDGYNGTVKNLSVVGTIGNAGIEMSGETAATFDGFNITMIKSAKEGGIYFKKAGIGGHFTNGTVTYNVATNGYGAIHSAETYSAANTSFTNVTLNGTNTSKFTGDSATGLESTFDSGTGNIKTVTKETLSGEITADKTLTADKVWLLTGLVAVKNGATLTIEPGTTVIGKAGTGANTSYLVVDAGSKINAAGTAAKPIIFTSETAYDGGADAWGQWGGLTIIGNAGNAQVDPYEVNPAFVAGTSNMADNSGVLTYVKILNSGITMEENKEINGLSLVGVGSGTTVDNITVDLSDDDGIEIWGGTVNLSNVTISRCSDDHFDIDDGFSGKVTNLNLNVTTGNAGIEMSGETAATFDGFNIAVSNSAKEGGIYFKKAGIGGHFKNGIITYDTTTNGYGAIHSSENNNATNTSFTNVTLKGSNTDKFTGDSAASIEASFDAGTNNIK